MPGQLLRRAEDLRGGRARLAGPRPDRADIVGDLLGAAGGLLNVAGDLLRRRALLLHGGSDARRVGGHVADHAGNLLDVGDSLPRGGLDLRDALADLTG